MMSLDTDAQVLISSNALTDKQKMALTVDILRTNFPNKTKSMTNAYIKNVLAQVKQIIGKKIAIADGATIKGKIKTWLEANYPDHKIEFSRKTGKLVGMIYFEGKE